MKKLDIKDINKDLIGEDLIVTGWIRNHRPQASFGFIDFADGTAFNHLQIVYDNTLEDFNKASHYLVGCALEVEGTLVKSEGKQDYELKAKKITLLGDSPSDYPIQPKAHSREFLREQTYLRPRTNLFQAVFRVRSVAAMAIHEYFQSNGYLYVHTPLITTADCEGENQMFKLTTLDLDNLPLKDGKCDYEKDLFNKLAFITGTGQLHGEAFAMAFKKIYTFGPTFRTENSNTKTHANEFWMIEPEIAFCNLDGLMDIEEDMLKYVVNYVLDKCHPELEFLDKFVASGLLDKLNTLVKSKFHRITHHEAIDILNKADIKWEFTPTYESDIAKEHERYLTDEVFKGPVFITNWPKDIKAWYMKENEDGKTVAAVDLEVPGAGELMGGSQREEDYDKLLIRAKNMHIDTKTVDWYCNLRKFGTCYHSGFGMGFERLIIYLTGVDNIRDVIPFPRTPGHCEY